MYNTDASSSREIVPFANSLESALHFKKHGQKFGRADEFEYEKMADQFLFGIMHADTHECVRPNALDRIRFNYNNRHFGVACILPEFVRTFYPVRPITIAKHGGAAGYFAYECGRTNL